MHESPQPLDTLQDIKRLMERSSRFISLSGWSGISAGICALVAAFFTAQRLQCWKLGDCLFSRMDGYAGDTLRNELILIGIVTFVTAFIFAFIFTYYRSRRNDTPVWNGAVRRLMWSVMGPLVAGGLFLYRMIQLHQYELVAPGCLIFYGLALINASKYTLGEVRYLGYGQVILGLVNLWLTGYGLHFWALGFGVLHIIYGIVMWYRHERIK